MTCLLLTLGFFNGYMSYDKRAILSPDLCPLRKLVDVRYGDRREYTPGKSLVQNEYFRREKVESPIPGSEEPLHKVETHRIRNIIRLYTSRLNSLDRTIGL